MTASALDKLATLENLRATWKVFWKTASKQRSSGVDDVTPAQFHANAERNLSRIHQQLRAGYRFSALRAHKVPKKDGKRDRIICIPTVADRLVQRLVADYLTQNDRVGIINEVSFGFIQNKGVHAARDRAIKLRTSSRWAYKSDISSFFDKIPRQELIETTIKVLRARSLHPLIAGAIACELEESPDISRIAQANGIVRGVGVRQGMPLSPVFANIILRDFDREMMRSGRQLVRYADDFIVLADSLEECLEIDAQARSLLGKLKFTLPPLGDAGSKTYIAGPDEEIEFLGLALAPNGLNSYRLILTDEQLEKVKRNLHSLTDIGQLIRKNIDIAALSQLVENKTAGYLAAYGGAENLHDLQKLLHASRTRIMRSIYVEAFGEEKVQKLNLDMRKFLGLEPT